MFERFKPRKGAAPPSLAHLRAQRADLSAAIKANEEEHAQITDLMPGLVVDPEQYGMAAARVEVLSAELRRDRGALPLLDEHIAIAEKRERQEELRRKAQIRKRESEQLAAILRRDWNPATAAVESLLFRLVADGQANEALRSELREAGVLGIPIVDAETIARQKTRKIPARPAEYYTTPRMAWLDAKGNEVQRQIHGRDGLLYQNPAAVKQVEKYDLIRAAEPETTENVPFERFEHAIQLVNMNGARLWPK